MEHLNGVDPSEVERDSGIALECVVHDYNGRCVDFSFFLKAMYEWQKFPAAARGAVAAEGGERQDDAMRMLQRAVHSFQTAQQLMLMRLLEEKNLLLLHADCCQVEKDLLQNSRLKSPREEKLSS